MNDMHRITLSAAVLLAAVPAGAAAWKVATLYWDRPVRHGAALLIAVSLALFAWALLVMPMSPILAASLLLALTLVTLTAIDVVVFRLPDPLTLPLVVVGLIVSAWLPDGRLVDHLIGALPAMACLRRYSGGSSDCAAMRGSDSATRSCWRRLAPGWAGAPCRPFC